MPNLEETIATYLAAWNEENDDQRRKLVDACWVERATYTDPMSHAEGRDGLLGLIAGFQQQMPGSRIMRTSGIDEHHGRVRFTWAVQGADGAQAMDGIDVGAVDGDGRLSCIIGFFGPPPPQG